MKSWHLVVQGKVAFLFLSVVLLASCGGESRSSMSLPKGFSDARVPLYPNATRITVNEADIVRLISDFVGTESLRFGSSTNISWTADTGAKVKEQLDELLPDANWRIEIDWSGSDQFQTSEWRNGDSHVVILYVDNLNSEQIRELRRLYGISDLQPGSTLVVTHVWDTTQVLPTATPTLTPTASPTATPTATSTSSPTPLPTSTPAPTPTSTLTPTSTPTPVPGSVLLEDNFDDGNAHGWIATAGSWNVVDGKYICVADEGWSFVGEGHWTDYVASAQIRPIAGRINVGLIGRLQDAEHFYLAQLIDNQARLFRRNSGRWEQLTERPYALEHNKQYQVQLEFRGTSISMYVNDALVTSVEDAVFLSGRAGLYCSTGVQASIDDYSVRVPQLRPTPTPILTLQPGSVLFEDSFDDGDANGWIPTSGSWNVVGGEYICFADEGRSLVGEGFWTDYAVGAEIKPLAGRIDAGLIGRAQDEEHFYLAQLIDNNARLFRRNSGRWEGLTDEPYALEYNQTYRVKLEFRGTRINMYINDALVTSIEDAAYLSGRVGLRCAAGARAAFTNVTVSTVP